MVRAVVLKQAWTTPMFPSHGSRLNQSGYVHKSYCRLLDSPYFFEPSRRHCLSKTLGGMLAASQGALQYIVTIITSQGQSA